MNQQYKKIFSVIFAVLIGVGIIFFAGKSKFLPRTEGGDLVGSINWRESLTVVPQKNPLKTLGFNGYIDEGIFTGATTTTDIIARKIILEYTESQKGAVSSTMSDADIQNIAKSLAEEVKLPPKKDYAMKDLNVSSDNSDPAGILYRKTLFSLMAGYIEANKKENELTIVLAAMNNGGKASLKKLDSKVLLYEGLIKNLLSMKTPSLIASPHLHLVQSMEALRSATVGLQSILVDPAMGVAALAEYSSATKALEVTSNEYRAFELAHQ